MSVLIGGFLILFGVIWTGIILAVSRGVANSGAPAQVNTVMHLMMGVGAVIFAIGVLMLIFGLIRGKKKRQLAMDIFQRGTLVKGTVTFVDKDYSMLVNNKPIFSIVEFTFQDSAGNTHTARKTGVNSDLVIRNKIEVGGQVAAKYLPENPGLNVLLLQDPAAAGANASV